MKPGPLASGRQAKRLLPLAVVVVVLVLASSAAESVYGGGESFSFNVYWPPPATYIQGSTPPTAYLEINYTGFGAGNFTYVITSNSTGTSNVVSQGNALVSNASPFRDWVFVDAPSNSVVVVEACVYRGTIAPQNLLYSKSITM